MRYIDVDELLNRLYWHKWVASQKGSVTIGTDDMDLYCVFINKLIKENKKLKNAAD